MAYFKLPAGVRDVLPDECRALNAAERALGAKFAEAGFLPVRTAGLEYYDTFAGIKSAVGQAKMFKMTDKDGNLIVLRPDMTLACARIAATKLHKDRAKLCYFSNIYDFSAGGNSEREVAQAGVEIFGEEGAFSDAYAVAFAAECLEEIGLKDFIIDIGHVGFYKGLLEGSGLSEAASEEIRGYINAKDAVNTEIALKNYGASERAQAAILALPSLFGGVSVLDEAAKLTDSPLALGALSHLKKVYAYLKEMKMEKYVSFDLGTVKSLAYYSGMVFTGLAEGVGAPVLRAAGTTGFAPSSAKTSRRWALPWGWGAFCAPWAERAKRRPAPRSCAKRAAKRRGMPCIKNCFPKGSGATCSRGKTPQSPKGMRKCTPYPERG